MPVTTTSARRADVERFFRAVDFNGAEPDPSEIFGVHLSIVLGGLDEQNGSGPRVGHLGSGSVDLRITRVPLREPYGS